MKESENASDSFAAAQLEKLRLEIAELKRKSKWESRVAQFIPVITTLVAIGGLWWNVNQFNIQQRANSLRDGQTREREIKKAFWEKQMALYIEASDAAAKIATLPVGRKDREKAEERFQQLYWGPLVLVEDEGVKDAMMKFNRCLQGLDERCRPEDLKNLSLLLANKCRASIKNAWKVELKEISIPPDTPGRLP